MIWHSHTAADVLTELQVDPTVGLSAREVTQRLQEYGINAQKQRKLPTFRQAFATSLRSPFTILLWVIASAVLILDLYKQVLRSVATYWYLPIIVAIMAVIAALLNALRQCRAASAADDVDNLGASDARVRRDGAVEIVSSLSLVPGDIVLLEVGDIVPADCRLIEANHLQCDESVLRNTAPVDKSADTLYDDITPLAQRTNMLYTGTTLTAGSAIAVVVSNESENRRDPHPAVKKRAKWLSLCWIAGVAVMSTLALIIGFTRVADRSAVLLSVAAMAVAALPTGAVALYALITARGVSRLLRVHRARILKPSTADMLGRVTTLCLGQDLLHQDGDITLCRAFVGHRTIDLTTDTPQAPGLGQLLRLAALNTTDTDPSGTAVLTRLHALGIDKSELLVDMPCIGTLPAHDGHNTTVHLAGKQALILISGQWRPLLPLCTKGNVDEVTTAAIEMEREGLQVLAVAYRLTDTAPSVYTAAELEQEMTCVGLLGLRMPIYTTTFANEAGLRTILFSDDSTTAAAAAATSTGLIDAPYVAVGETIARFSDHDLISAVQHYNVYCGCDLVQKQRILTALRQQGDIIAIAVHQGENTALLPLADVGVAVGVATTNAITAAADVMVLENDCTAVHAILDEGHRLRAEKVGLFVYLLVVSIAIAFVGVGGFYGLFPLLYVAPLMMGLHILFFALPIPLLVIYGISNAIHKLRKKS